MVITKNIVDLLAVVLLLSSLHGLYDAQLGHCSAITKILVIQLDALWALPQSFK